MSAPLEAKVQALRSVRLFERLSERSLERIAETAAEVDFPPGHVLIEPKSKGSGMFVIEEGTVTVQAPGVQAELGPGEVVGELALIRPDGERSARVQAKTQVRGLAIRREEFRELLAAEPSLGIAILEVVAERLAEP